MPDVHEPGDQPVAVDGVRPAALPKRRPNRELRFYYGSAMTFMLPGSIQSVLYPFLVAVVLHETADRVGIAQMAGQLPALLLILVGGLIADRFDQRRILFLIHCAAAIPPMCLALLIHNGQLSFGLLVSFALLGGVFGALSQPARDSLLNHVSGGALQRTITVTIGLNFGVQIVGYAIASLADRVGVVPLMMLQAAVIGSGAYFVTRISKPSPMGHAVRRHPLLEIGEGFALVLRHADMRPSMLLTFSVGLFFAGTFVVLLPLIVRDVYQGTAQDIALSFSALMLGTLVTIVWMVRRGGIQRQGRAMLLALLSGSVFLLPLTFALPFPLFLFFVFLWGLGGGVQTTMGRTIIQQVAPDSHRARVMSVYSLGAMGGMPIGSLVMGYAVSHFGPLHAVWVPVVGMAVIVTLTHFTSKLWWQVPPPVEPQGGTSE